MSRQLIHGALLFLLAGAPLLAQPPTANARKLQGRPVCSTAPTSGQVLTWQSTQSCWEPAAVRVVVSTSGPVTVADAGFYFNNAAGALTYNLPAITSGSIGSRFCFRNLATRTGAITLQAPATTYIDKDGANGSAAGTIVSSGALADSACVLAVTTTQYVFYLGSGTWANN